MSSGKPVSVLPSVVTPKIEGVSVARAPLERAVVRMFRNGRRIGRRIEKWLKENPDAELPHWVIWGADYEQRFTFAALREQRERAKMTPGKGAPAMDDATFAKKMRDLAQKAILEMSRNELAEVVSWRGLKLEPLPADYCEVCKGPCQGH